MPGPIRLGITIHADGSAQVTGEINRVRGSLNEANTAAQGANRQFAELGRTMGSLSGIIAGLGIAGLAREMLKTVEQVQNMDVRLKGLTKSSKDYADVQVYLSGVSQRHHKDNLVLADSFSRLLTLEQSGIITRKQSTALLEGMSNAASKTGATTEQLKQSMFGFSQAMSSGVVHAEELNQVTEPIPGLLNKMAASAGYTAGEFRKLVADGRITSEVFGKIMVESFNSYQGAAEAAGNTLTAKYADVRNAWIDLAKAVEAPVSETVTPVLNAIRSVIQGLAQDAREVNQLITEVFRNGLTGGAPDNGMAISLEGRAKPPEAAAVATEQNAIRAEIEKTAATHVKAKKAHKEALTDAQKAAKALAQEYSNLTAQLEREIALQGSNDSKAAAMEYDVTRGSLEKLTESKKLYLLQLASEIDNAALDAKAKEAVKTELDSLIDKYNQLTLSARDYYQLKLTSQGIAPGAQGDLMAQFDKNASAEQTKNDIDARKQAYAALKTEVGGYSASINEAASETQSLSDITSALFDSSSTGINRLAGAFKGLVKTTQDYGRALAENQKKMDKAFLADNEKEYQKQLKERGEIQAQQLADTLGGFRQMAGAASQMFSEQSAGRKALHNMEMVFGAVELAMRLKNMVALAAEAVLTQGKGDPYSAFARIAAMIAIVGGVVAAAGGAFSAGGSAPVKPTGSNDTGTVLGDATATSDSANKVFELLKTIHAEEYAELKGINKGVKTLHDAITGTVTRIFQSDNMGTGIYDPSLSGLGSKNTQFTVGFGGVNADPILNKVIGFLFGGKVTKEIVGGGLATAPISIADAMSGNLIGAAQYNTVQTTKKGGLFGKDKVSFETVLSKVDEGVQESLTKLFKGVGETMIGLADLLGTDLADRVKNYIIPTVMIELRGLSAEDATKKLNGVISTMIDEMAGSVFGDIIGQYQKLGEGMLETAIRIVSEVAVVRDAIKQSGGTLKENSIALADALIQAAGSIEEFQKQFASYYDKFFSDAEKQARLTEKLNGMLLGTLSQDEINKLGESRKAFRDVMDGLSRNLNAVGATEKYSLLLSIADAADQYYAALEKGREDLGTAYVKNNDSIQSTIDGITQMTDALKTFRNSLITGNLSTLTPAQKLAQLKSDYDAVIAATNSSDQKTRDDAIGKLPTTAQAFLEASRVYNASSQTYINDYNDVMAQVNKALSSQLTALDIAKQQLTVLQDIKAAVERAPGARYDAGFLQDQISPISDFKSWGSAQLGRQLNDFETQWIADQFITNRSREDIMAEASAYIARQPINGSHKDGLDFVPFDGYRAELHKGERVLTASQSRGIEGTSQEVIAELRALRAEVEQLRKDQRDHTGALIQSNYDANERAANKVADGVQSASKDSSWRQKSAAIIK
jgi:tape measure domain-containing protein